MRKAEFKSYKASDIDLAINEWVHNKQYREILKLLLIDGFTYQQIADKFFLSESAVIKIFDTYGNVLQHAIKENKKD